MKGLIVKGKAKVGKMEFNHIEGGFGKNKKSMLARDIAQIHNKEVKHINEAINSNRKRFSNNIDILDLKSVDLLDRDLLSGMSFSSSSISNSKNIYLLSERGYSKLLKILEDDFAWEQYDKLVDEYFGMREIVKGVANSDSADEDKLLIQKQRAEAMLLNARTRQAKLILDMQKNKTLSPVAIELLGVNAMEMLTNQQSGYRPEIEKTYTATEIAKELGVSANRVGKVANANNVKTAEFGISVLDKARHSNKQVESWRYNEKGRARLIELFQEIKEG